MLDLPFAYRLTMVCLNSLVYLGFFFVDLFVPPFDVFYYSMLVRFFDRESYLVKRGQKTVKQRKG